MNRIAGKPTALRAIRLIVIHCSATRVTRDFSARDVDTAHRYLGYSCWGYHYYIRKSGMVERMRPEQQKGAHCYGHNTYSIGVCYEGGLDENGHPADTRTLQQIIVMHELVRELWTRYPEARVVGHRDLSPDLNHNGVVEKFEWIKMCPCFDVIPEFRRLR